MRHDFILPLIAGAAVPLGHALACAVLPEGTAASWALVVLVGVLAAALIHRLLRRWLVGPLRVLAGAPGDPLAALDARLRRAAGAEARLAELEQTTSALRHDLRGILSPALLTADRLLQSQDPATRRAGEVVVRTVERANERLSATKLAAPDA
ncbi:MAG TPA: hypothetical protein VMI52_01905 [Acetobacteraceae bacterium]|nr:hypothetical protein [Acetobacteraceae bacterium]